MSGCSATWSCKPNRFYSSHNALQKLSLETIKGRASCTVCQLNGRCELGSSRNAKWQEMECVFAQLACPVTFKEDKCTGISKTRPENNINFCFSRSHSDSFQPFHSQVQKQHPTFREMHRGAAVSTGHMIIFYLSKLRKAKFFILFDVCNISGEVVGEI